MRRARPARLLVVGALGLLGLAAVASEAAAQDPTVAPTTSLSSDGRTVSGAGKSLSASQVHGLAAGGQAVTVSGAGYDVNKGVYVTLCVIPPTNHPPTPCGGGQDQAGTSGASSWISSNPPAYASGLTTPYGPGGSFTVTLQVRSTINATLDCATVRCAIVTRNDHTRGSDRSQDLFIPVSFAAPAAPGQPTTTTTAPPVVTSTTVPPPDPSTIPPVTTASGDGLSVSDGTRTLAVSRADDLDPAGAELAVRGTGYDPAAGVYVALCRVPESGQPPGPCSTGEDAAAWISSSPPDYGVELAEPYDDGGTFRVTLTISPVIDADTDCRKVACAIATRSDDTAAADRTRDLLVPVAFGEPRSTTTASTVGEQSADEVAMAASSDGGGDGSSAAWLAIGTLAVATGAAVLVIRAIQRRRAAPPA